MKIVDRIIPEPPGGAHRNFEATAAAVRDVVRDSLAVLSDKSADVLVTERYEKFRRIGVFEEDARALAARD